MQVGLIMSAETEMDNLFKQATDEEKHLVMQHESIILDDLKIKQVTYERLDERWDTEQDYACTTLLVWLSSRILKITPLLFSRCVRI